MKYLFSLALYRIISLLISPLLVIALLFRSLSQQAYRQRLDERFGCYRQKFRQHGIVIHAASVGEVLALKAFIEQTINQFPRHAITVTTFTPTGSAQVGKLFGDRVQHCYLPFDNYISHSLFLRALKPKALVFMETELWPSLVSQCSAKNIKLLLINGRLSPSSMNSYRKLAWLITPTLTHFDNILTQSQPNQANFEQLGANSLPNGENADRCQLVGNLKYDISIDQATLTKVEQLQQALQTPRQLWVLASSHDGDEQPVIAAYQQLKKQFPQLLLTIIPRHPERFEKIANMAEPAGLTIARRSRNQAVSEHTDIWLIDTLGELLATTALAQVVTMGGSFSHIGGHNPLEPALFKKPIIVGADMHNFTEVVSQLQQQAGIIVLKPAKNSTALTSQLVETVAKLLTSAELQQQLGENAYQVVLQNQGASNKCVAVLAKLLASNEDSKC